MSFVLNFLNRLRGFEYDVVGSFDDIQSNIAKLIASPTADGVLVIQVVGHEAFIQFSREPDEVSIDYPIFTDFQRSNEFAARQFFSAHHLEIRETRTTNGSLSLDIGIAPDPSKIAALVRQFLISVFRISPDVKLQFMGERLGVAA